MMIRPMAPTDRPYFGLTGLGSSLKSEGESTQRPCRGDQQGKVVTIAGLQIISETLFQLGLALTSRPVGDESGPGDVSRG
jgi:hypothetical protein